MSAAPKKIAIAAGGTAGHVVPALAVADALRAEGAQVSFIGADRAEAELVPVAGYPLYTIAVEGLHRRNPLLAARAALRSARAFVRSRALLAELAPDAVMGGGGYVSGPVGLAALTRGVPLVLTEADSHLGLANRALAPFARRVCLAFAIDGRGGPRYRVTGRPIPPPQHDRVRARERFGIAPQERCVLVFGGSLGARTINRAALGAFAHDPRGNAPRDDGPQADGPQADGPRGDDPQADGPREDFHVLHVCGRRDFASLAREPRRAGYDLREYLDVDAFNDALAAGDLVVARAGGSVFELAAHGLPAILVPYPHAAADHQRENARWMQSAGAALTIEDAQLTPERLAREVHALLGDPPRLAAMAAASRALARPDAAREVARELLEATGERPRARSGSTIVSGGRGS